MVWCPGSSRRSTPRGGRPESREPGAAPALNRAEYANAIRDLLALDVDASTLLPPDDSSRASTTMRTSRVSPGATRALLDRGAQNQRARRRRTRPSVRAPKPTACAATLRRTSTCRACPWAPRGGLLIRHMFPLERRIHLQREAARDGAWIDPRPRVSTSGRALARRRTTFTLATVGGTPTSPRPR